MPDESAPSNPLPGQFIGRYRIVRELARSNDIVYEAVDPTMNRRVAIKQLNLPGNLGGEQKRERIERFKREAKAAGTLNHRNIVTIYEIGHDKNLFFIAMEYLSGQSLRNYMSVNGPLPVRLSMQIALELCDALGYAHSKSIVHRDVKPDNVHLVPPDNSVKLTDFGIARVMEEPSLTATGQVFGTPSYMSPEQLSARQVDHRTDLFSLGVMLYEILTGRKPFHGDNIVSVTYQIMNAPVTFPAGMPAGITAVLRRALAKDPELRYPNAAAMAADIRSELVLHDPPYVNPLLTTAGPTNTFVVDIASDPIEQPVKGPEPPASAPTVIAPGASAGDSTVLVGASSAAAFVREPAQVSGLPDQQPATAPAGQLPPAAAIAESPTIAATSSAPVDTSPAQPSKPAAQVAPISTSTIQPEAFHPAPIGIPPRNTGMTLGASVTAIVVLLVLMIWAIDLAYHASVKTNQRVVAADYYNKAVAASAANRPAEAISDYTQALKLSGENADIANEAKLGLGQAYTALGDTQAQANDVPDATASYQSAIQNDPYNPLAHYGLAEISDGPTRLSELDLAIRNDPTGKIAPNARPEAAAEYSKQADAAYASGDKDTARSAWMRVIELVPGDPLAAQAHQRLDSAGL